MMEGGEHQEGSSDKQVCTVGAEVREVQGEWAMLAVRGRTAYFSAQVMAMKVWCARAWRMGVRVQVQVCAQSVGRDGWRRAVGSV